VALTQEQVNFLAAYEQKSLKIATKTFNPVEVSPTITAEYMRELRKISNEVTDLVDKYILPVLKETENQYVRTELVADIDAKEALAQGFAAIALELTKQEVELERYAIRLVTHIFIKAETFHRKKWVSEINRIAGVDLNNVLTDKSVKGELLNKIEENVSLIKTLRPQYLNRVKKAVKQGLEKGDDFFSIKESLEEIKSTNVNYRPKLIARDQMGKLTGDLNRIRQQDVGIEEYKWRTSHDSAVRQSHKDNGGKTFSWNAPPKTGHPGQDVNCRCIAEPIFEEWLQEIDSQKSWAPEKAPPPLVTSKVRRPPKRAVPKPPPPRSELSKPRTGEKIRLDLRQQQFDRMARFVKNDLNKMEMLTNEERRKVLQWNWVHGSNRKVSIGIKEAIKQEFELQGTVFNPRGFQIPKGRVWSLQKDVRSIYRQTQKELRKRGIKSVRLYRGITKDVVGSGVLESWTTDPKIAAKFGKKVLVKDVPANKIFNYRGSSNWVDGIWGDQKEVMVMS